MRIVLVEPSRLGLKIMTGLLQQHGHEILPFRDGGEALEHIVNDPDVDILVTSLETPTVGGLELCWTVRAQGDKSRPIYVIAMSSNYDRERLSEALDSGADDYVSKPPNPQELFARLRVAERVLTAQRQLIRLATRDPLTDLLNRRSFLERAAEAMREARVKGTSLCAVMVDIDHFKLVNDRFGHDAGDEVIRTVSRMLMGTAATVGRLGGEEFAIILERQTDDDAAVLAERLRREIAGVTIRVGDQSLTVTVSIGIDEAREGDDVPRILKRADQALYAAKNSGSNKVVTYSGMLSFSADDLLWAEDGSDARRASAA